MIDKVVYLYISIACSVVSLLFFILFFLAKRNIWMKIRSIIAKKTNKVLVKYTDPEKGYFEDFCHIRENTIRIKPPGSFGRMIGINPDHIYFDSVYYIRAVNINEAGSYIVTGTEHKDGSIEQRADQQYISGEMADMMVRKALMSPKSENEMFLWIKILLVAVGIVAAICLLNAYLSYNMTQTLETLPGVIKSTGII